VPLYRDDPYWSGRKGGKETIRRNLCPYCGRGDKLSYNPNSDSKPWQCGHCKKSFLIPSGTQIFINRAINSVGRTKKWHAKAIRNPKSPEQARELTIEQYETKLQVQRQNRIIFIRRVIIGAAIMLAATIIVAIILSV